MSFDKDYDRRQPSKAARKRVKQAFDADALIDLCARQDFTPYAKRYDLPSQTNRPDRFYWHQDNGSDILAVAHLDSVQHNSQCSVTGTGAGLLATSGVLDDRLGVYVILDMLPKLGIICDVLLTTDEEQCWSTASEFHTDKWYNWMIQFDRGGTDVVMYQYETTELCALVHNCGAQVATGTYSDIADLGHLGCSGFNWGVGYRDYHSARSHAWLEDTFRMVARFEKFHRANHDIYLPYEDDWQPKRAGFFDDDEDDSEDYLKWWRENHSLSTRDTDNKQEP